MRLRRRGAGPVAEQTSGRRSGAGSRAPAEARGYVHPREHRWILTVVLLLVAFGSVMVYSASSARPGLAGSGSGSGLFVKTLVMGVLPGVTVLFLLQRISLQQVRMWTKPLLYCSIGALIAVRLPGIGQEVNGATRWLGAGAFKFQPSEIAKIAVVLTVADRAVRFHGRIRTLGESVIKVQWPILVCCGLIAIEPDLGTSIVCFVTGVAVLYMAGTPGRFVKPVVVGVVSAGTVFAVTSPYRLGRLMAFLDPWSESMRQGKGFQLVQGQIAIGSGGVFGSGLGQSVQKSYFLPEAHTDFILAVIGEELGMLAILALLAAFAFLMWNGINLSRDAVDPYAKLTAAGLTALITCQALLNICVVLGVAPLTGVPLPFISYGPSNLIVLLSACGLLLNIAATGGVSLQAVDSDGEYEAGDADADPDRSRGYGRSRHSGAQRR